tara:strand:- start:975 stop:2039 length:1065 start_codon:yes stop_codon:yes gene_type:complete
MKKEKILLIGTSRTNYDGWLTMSLGLFNEFKNQGYRIYYLEGQDPKRRLKLFSLNFNSHIDFTIINIILDSLRVTLAKIFFRPKYVIVIPETLTLASYISNFFFRTPYFLYSAGTYAVKMLSSRGFLSRIAMDNCKMIFAMSKFTKKKYLQLKYKDSKIKIVKSGYDETSYFKRENIEKIKGRLVFVGNCKPRKGLFVLIEALKALPETKRKEVSLNIVTSDTSQNKGLSKLLNKIPDLKYQLHKTISNDSLSKLYASSQLNILPSISEDIFFEGFGIVHYEAIASGCLSVGSFNSGNTCAIDKGNGFLIHQNDYIALKDLINKVIDGKLSTEPNGLKPKTWNYVVNTIKDNLE